MMPSISLYFLLFPASFTFAFQFALRPQCAVGKKLIHSRREKHPYPYIASRSSRMEMSKDQEPPLTAFLDKASKTGIDNTRIQVNSLVVTKYDVPELGIYADQTYELQSVYLQGQGDTASKTEDGTKPEISTKSSATEFEGLIEKIELQELNLEDSRNVFRGYTLYIRLYSPMYHDNDKFGGKAVIVTPEEVGLVSMKDEVVDSVLVALPILSFWLGTCFVFANTYNQRYGGSLVDALFGR